VWAEGRHELHKYHLQPSSLAQLSPTMYSANDSPGEQGRSRALGQMGSGLGAAWLTGLFFISSFQLSSSSWSEKGVRLAQKMQVGPCIPVGIQLFKAEVGPTSGPTRRLSHLDDLGGGHLVVGLVDALQLALHVVQYGVGSAVTLIVAKTSGKISLCSHAWKL
jgi:hypothetical protein